LSGKLTPVSSSESSHSRFRGLRVARRGAAADEGGMAALLLEAVGADVARAEWLVQRRYLSDESMRLILNADQDPQHSRSQIKEEVGKLEPA
jgi:hypothetical protein